MPVGGSGMQSATFGAGDGADVIALMRLPASLLRSLLRNARFGDWAYGFWRNSCKVLVLQA